MLLGNNYKICCIFNLAPYYNASIYKLMDEEFNCDFYIGDHLSAPMKLMNYDSLKGFKRSLRYIPLFGNFYWQIKIGEFGGQAKLFKFKNFIKYN